VNSAGERGLLGIAFDPNFVSNQYVYVYYTATTPALHNRISRFTANGDVALPGSEVVILELNNLSGATNHNGGAIHFGPDGMLYAGVGENANGPNAQTLNNLLGKILRLNPDGTIPSDNPFYNIATGNNRAIWALGLRNPFTFTFQPGTGRMFVNDVGQDTWEEINDGIAASNYGWPATEGPTGDPQYRSPLFYYGHGESGTTGCAIAGGAFYNPSSPTFPGEYLGDYFFADFCSGWIRRFDPNDGSVADFAMDISLPVDLMVSPDGGLYYLARGSGAVFRIDYAPSNPVPAQMTSPPPGSTFTSSTVTFTWSAGVGVSAYWLEVGTTPGGNQIYPGSPVANLSATVPGLPSNGSTVYVRLWSLLGGAWEFNDYTYTSTTTGSGPVMQSPPPGSTLTSSTVTFNWSAGSGVAAYWLEVGTTPGGNQIYYGSPVLDLFATVPGLPTDGSTVYTRLWWLIGGVWQFNDYTYTSASASAGAVMQSPPPGSTLTSSTVTFTWSAGSGVAAYWLEVGTTPGGNQIYYGSPVLDLSATVYGIPTNGSIIYVRLWSFIGGVWQFEDYTYNTASRP
jgi:hypothetical protein